MAKTTIGKNAYEMISKERGCMGKDRIWTTLWKWRVLERIKLFVWKVCKDGLLTKEARFKRGLSSSGYKWCPNLIEDNLPFLRDYKNAKQMWLSLLDLRNKNLLFSLDMKEWMSTNTSPKLNQHVPPNWPTI